MTEPAQYTVDDDSCIACGLCHVRAPENIEMDEEAMTALVVRQPSNDDEEDACNEAADYCPTGGLSATKPKAATG